jgi:hypothetical protein
LTPNISLRHTEYIAAAQNISQIGFYAFTLRHCLLTLLSLLFDYIDCRRFINSRRHRITEIDLLSRSQPATPPASSLHR